MSELRILDYRNAKYQGQTKGFNKNGFGILLDEQFTLIIGQWANNILNGSCFIIYPENTIFYGTMKKGLPNNLCIYQIPNKYSIYVVYNDGKPLKKIAICLDKTGIIIQAQIIIRSQKQELAFIIDTSFKTIQQKNRLIANIFNIQLKDSYFNCLTFIEKQFQNKYNYLIQTVYINRNRIKQICIGFKKGETLGISLLSNCNLLSLGHYHKDYHLKDAGKKILDTSTDRIIQQAVYINGQVYNYKQNHQRPIQITKSMQKYFKQSLTFINQFINLKDVYQNSRIYKLVQDILLDNVSQKYAQVQLEENNIQAKSKLKIDQYTIDQIKKDVYAALNRKKSHTKNYKGEYISPQKSPYKYSPTKNTQIPPKQSPPKIIENKYKYSPSRNTQQSLSPYKQSKYSYQPNNRNRSNRVSYYYQKDYDKTIQNKISPQKNNTSNKKYESPPKKYDSPKKSKSKIKYLPVQSLAKLTEDYQNIKQSIKRQTPKSKKNTNNFRGFKYNQIDKNLARSKKKQQIEKTPPHRKIYKYTD